MYLIRNLGKKTMALVSVLSLMFVVNVSMAYGRLVTVPISFFVGGGCVTLIFLNVREREKALKKKAQDLIEKAKKASENHEYNAAVSYLDRAVELDPEIEGVEKLKTGFCIKSGQFNRALIHVKEALLEESDEELYYMKGICHYNLSQKTEALTCFEKSTSIDPSNKQAQYYVAELSKYFGERSKAVAAYNKYLRLEEDRTLKMNVLRELMEFDAENREDYEDMLCSVMESLDHVDFELDRNVTKLKKKSRTRKKVEVKADAQMNKKTLSLLSNPVDFRRRVRA